MSGELKESYVKIQLDLEFNNRFFLEAGSTLDSWNHLTITQLLIDERDSR